VSERRPALSPTSGRCLQVSEFRFLVANEKEGKESRSIHHPNAQPIRRSRAYGLHARTLSRGRG